MTPKIPKLTQYFGFIIGIIYFCVSVYIGRLQHPNGLFFEFLLVVQFQEELVGFILTSGEEEELSDGDDEEGDDEDSPETDDDAHDAPPEGFGEEIAVADGGQSDDDVPHAVCHGAEILA